MLVFIYDCEEVVEKVDLLTYFELLNVGIMLACFQCFDLIDTFNAIEL